jgi:DNA-binding NarL/FixJ family response regulator
LIATEARARILVVDDQRLFSAGLVRLLAEDERLDIVGQAADGLEAIQMVEQTKPDLVLMDLKMPRLDGVETTRRLLAANPDLKILVLTAFEADTYVVQALRAGASGYLLKDAAASAVVSAIIASLAGEKVMASAVATRVLAMLSGTSDPKDFYDGLTMREVEILRLLAGGMNNKQIAYHLKISDKTVRNHISNMYEKLHIYDRAQAALYAVRKGLIDV